MNIPSLPGIVDLVALQNTIALLLLSDDRLAQVPILTEIKLHMDNEIAVDALWTLPRAAIQVKPGTIDLFSAVVDTQGSIAASGRVGAGLLVEMPTANCPSNNVTGPPLTWQVSVVAMEERNTNLTGQGISQFIMAEQLAQLVLDILHLQGIFSFGTLKASASAVQPARDWETLKPGIVCWRTTLDAIIGRVQTPRSALVAGTFVAGQCVLSCNDPAATMLYTTDGSSPVKGNPSAQTYVNPFNVNSGTLVLSASFKAGLLVSSITGAIAP